MAKGRGLKLLSPLTLDTRPETGAFWGAVALVATSLVVLRFPPLVDYSQHLAIVAIMDRILDGNALEAQRFDVQWITYNGFFHLVATLLGRLLPVEVAGKVVLFTIPWLTAGAALGVVRLAQKPTAYAFLALPVLYSRTLGRGFLNFSIGAPLCVLTLIAWLRWWVARRTSARTVVALSTLLAWVHPFAHIALGLAALVSFLALERPAARASLLGREGWLARGVRAAAPFVPSVLLGGVLFARHMASPNLWFNEAGDGIDVPVWTKLFRFSDFAGANFRDRSDSALLWVALGLLVTSWVFLYFRPSSTERGAQAKPRELERALSAVAVLWVAVYAICPQMLFSTGFVFERFLLLAWLVLPACIASLPARLERGLGRVCMALGTLSAVNVAWQFSRIEGQADADAIIERIPEHARVIGLLPDRRGDPSVSREIYIHLPAYALVRRPVELAFDFTRYASLPVSSRVGVTEPPRVPGGFEWQPSWYNPQEAYARYYDWVLIASREADPSALLGRNRDRALLVLRRGRFSLYRLE